MSLAQTPPPLFKQGSSARVRLLVAAFSAVVLLNLDALLWFYVNGDNIPANIEKRMLDEDITEQEVLDTMENLPIGKSAGPNRIPNAMYRYLHIHLEHLCSTEMLQEIRQITRPRDPRK